MGNQQRLFDAKPYVGWRTPAHRAEERGIDYLRRHQ